MESVLIVLNYNDAITTKKLINNAENIKKIDKIVVVDNNSSDNSLEELEKLKGEKTDVIKAEKNGGYAYGNNYGVTYARRNYSPKYNFIANPYIELGESVIEGILKFFETQALENKKIGVVSGKMVTTTGAKIHPAWKLPTYGDCLWENLMVLRKLLRVKSAYYNQDYFMGKESKVDVVSGAFFAIETKTFVDMGMLDESTFLYGEENILAYKLKKEGYDNYILNQYEFLHHHSVSISKNIKSTGKKLDLAYESRCIYLDKYLKAGKIKKIIHAVTYKVGKINYLLAKRLTAGTK